MHHRSLNYDYVLERALTLSTSPKPDVLDFGCGTGALLALADERGFAGTLFGADSFAGMYQNWADSIADQHRNRIRRIEDNVIPFDDASFDVVVSNQVFEHVFQPLMVLGEIKRVLKPGGAFLALFPTSDVWFEGHLGIYFVHWLHAVPRTQHAYCRLCRSLGFGYYNAGRSAEAWATGSQAVLRDSCIYHHRQDVGRWWKKTFGAEPESLADDYMAWRLARDARLSRLNGLTQTRAGRAVLRFICHKRAGRVLVARKP